MTDRFRITQAWARRFEEEKIPTPALLRRAGLPPNLFQREKIFLTTAEIFALWRAVAALSPDPGFGLKLGTELRFERSHPVSIAGVCSRSFGDALQRLARYKQLTCPEEIRITGELRETAVEFFFIEADEPQPEIMVDLGLSWILGVGRQGSDGAITPLRLDLTRPERHRAMLESHFRCPVHFSAGRDALVFHTEDLERPFPTHNEELLAVLGAHLDSEVKARNTDMGLAGEVRRALRQTLAGKRPTVLLVARELGMGARTLQRRLAQDGVTFQQLVEETRRELARHYLKQATVELNETAFLLGFEDANSFYRAFHQWEGVSPGEFRDRAFAERATGVAS